MAKLTCKLITELPSLMQHKELWERFHSNNNNATMCMNWYWISLWCRHYLTSTDKLHVQFWFDNHTLVAICPFYIKKRKWLSELRFIGTGENSPTEVCSEFQDFLIAPNYQAKVFKAVTASLFENSHFYSINIDIVLTDSHVALWLKQLMLAQWKLEQHDIGVRYLVPIESNQSEQISNIRSKTTRRQANKFSQEKNVTCNLVNTKEALEHTYQQLIQLHNKAWLQKGKRGAFTDQHFVCFHRDFTDAMLNSEQLIMFTLNIKDQAVATYYGVIENDVLYYYQSGIQYSSALPAVGTAMHIQAMDIARQKNVFLYDFMKGAKHSYKNKYRNSHTTVANYTLTKFPYSYLIKFDKLARKLKNALVKAQHTA
ncbi:GNAT family N-acetyltransferase [Thalassotalea castellviae]|uniref:GNAT family N-acetyltransferase n=1 Tax=Thalassotalea castellviae TaxID=3075612 RepID=A0ABU3A0V1_9GAMM|nr:GNAT family N-acetyltransferase [Thalassotalea sp. W431]MDT0603807.1 GNAT family N-acetyltransferase [Thalassotalea sp. W431]